MGTVRTYARIPDGQPFTYDAWMEAVRRAETFVTYGPLLEFAVDGQPLGSRIAMPPQRRHAGRDLAGRQRHRAHDAGRAGRQRRDPRERGRSSRRRAAATGRCGSTRAAWLALLVRGHYADKPEIIAAHSSPVMVEVEGSPLLAAADAVTILEQIEGALAYLDTVGTRAEDRGLQAHAPGAGQRRTAACTTACTSRGTITSTTGSGKVKCQQRGDGNHRRAADSKFDNLTLPGQAEIS